MYLVKDMERVTACQQLSEPCEICQQPVKEVGS